MGSFEWMEVETLSTEIAALESRLAAAKSRHNFGLVKVVKEQIAAAQQRRARYLAHITTSLAESLDPPAPPEPAAQSRQRGAKSREGVADLVAEAVAEEPAAADQAIADPVADPVQEGLAEEAVQEELAATDEATAGAVAEAVQQEPAAEEPAAEAVPEEPAAEAVQEEPAGQDQPSADLDDPAAPEIAAALAEAEEPGAQAAKVIADSDVASPHEDTIEGVSDVWDQLTPSHIERAKQELNVRRAEMLTRHAEELKALEADQSEIDALAQAIDVFVRKFNSPAAASVVRLDEERDRLQSQA